jgi:prepilin-type N-terminal cleavage/methylation domain
MKSRSQGFTLTELMVGLALVAIILAVGAPSFTEFRRNNRLAGISNDFLAAIQVARTEAIKRQLPTAVCPSNNPTADDAAVCSAGAFTGWIAFVDVNSNCLRDAPATDVLLNTGAVKDTAVNARSSGNCISFASTGFRQTIAGRPTAFRTLFCDSRGTVNQAGTTLSAARQIEVIATGRSRITRLPADLLDTSIGPTVACP